MAKAPQTRAQRTTASVLIATLVVAGVIWLPVASSAQNAEAPRPVDTVIQDFAFEQGIVVDAGTAVSWQNLDPADHTITASDGSFDSGALYSNASFEHRFSEPGMVSYSCLIHPSMTGTITVRSLDADGGPAITAPGTTVLQSTTILDSDPLGLGGPALRMLVPEGWNVEGGPVWRHHYSNLASFEGRVASPDWWHGVEYFALYPQIWQEGGIPFFPEGSNYLGNDVRAPIRDASVFIESLILPAYRAEFGARVIDRLPLPDVAAATTSSGLPDTEVVAERVLTEHFVDGRRMLEEFTVVLTFTPNPFIPGAVAWTPQQLFSIRAPADEFDAARPLLDAIAASPVIDLDWYAGYQYVHGLSVRNGLAAIEAAGAASRIISDANAQITDTIISGYQERQAVNDRVFEAWSQTIRGVETYTDPFGAGTLELPNGYDYVYGAADGSVVLTNEPSFDPVQALPDKFWQQLAVER